MVRTSDQPLQVKENIDLFMNSLNEAIALVVLVSWIGFWSWRLALLMSISIPLTLGMTFGMMYLLGIDLQQVSIASLIIALGLLVDVPVVAGDAINGNWAWGTILWLRPGWDPPSWHRHDLCHHHQYRGLSAFSYGRRRYRALHLQPAHRPGLLINSLPSRVHDLHPLAGVLSAPAAQDPGGAHRRAAPARLPGRLLQVRPA